MKEGTQLQDAIKLARIKIEDALPALGISRSTLFNYYKLDELDDDVKQRASILLKKPIDEIFYKPLDDSMDDSAGRKLTGKDISARKAFGDRELKGIVAVPIGAQANYSRHFMDPVFETQLERFYIPGFPYDGDRFKAWQVEGDSMTYINKETGREEGLLDREWIITEEASVDNWNSIRDWYIYTIVTATLITIKRLYRLNDLEFVMIPDNPDYSQEIMNIKDIREIWVFKRKLEWNAAPPRKYEITVQSKLKPE